MKVIGVIIEESLADKLVLSKLKIVSTEIKSVTEEHQTPWLKQWTLHTVEIPIGSEEEMAVQLSKSIENEHNCSWYIDFKNDIYHWIIFSNKVFKVDRKSPEQNQEAVNYGLSLGIPAHQLDWEM